MFQNAQQLKPTSAKFIFSHGKGRNTFSWIHKVSIDIFSISVNNNIRVEFYLTLMWFLIQIRSYAVDWNNHTKEKETEREKECACVYVSLHTPALMKTIEKKVCVWCIFWGLSLIQFVTISLKKFRKPNFILRMNCLWFKRSNALKI